MPLKKSEEVINAEPAETLSPELLFMRDFKKAAAEFQNLEANKVNSHFKSKYISLDVILDYIKPIFNKHGITIWQPITRDGLGNHIIKTYLWHTSGHRELAGEFPLTGNYQNVIAGATYARRGMLCSICGISVDTDDDGNKASGIVYKAPSQPSGEWFTIIPMDLREKALKYCKGKGWVGEGQTLAHLSQNQISLITSNLNIFLSKLNEQNT